MRVLLDECPPRHVSRELVGHSVRTVTKDGWPGITNGELLRLAAQHYDAFITIDQRLQREVTAAFDIAVITLRAPTNSMESLRPLVPDIIGALEDIRPSERIVLSTTGT